MEDTEETCDSLEDTTEVSDMLEDMAETGDSNIQTSNEGWADIMQKILKTKKPRRKKSIVLSKAKKLSCLKPAVKEETSTTDESETKMRKMDWINKGRVKPDPLDRNREKLLQKITVRGVVCLYNAVNQHQKQIASTADTSTTVQQEKQLKSINKNMFLDILLKGSTSADSSSSTNKNKQSVNEEQKNEDDGDSNTWSVLKNNFLSGKKWQNWDKTNPENIEAAYD